MAKNEIVIRVPVSKLMPNPWGSGGGLLLADEDYERLRLSIERDDIQMPLIAWRRGKSPGRPVGEQPPPYRQGIGVAYRSRHRAGVRR